MKDKLRLLYYWCICVFVFVCNTLTGEGANKYCLNDETYQPQFLVCLPMAQRCSLPHALLGIFSNPANHIHLHSSTKCFCLSKSVQNGAGEHQLLEPKRPEQHLASEESGAPASKWQVTAKKHQISTWECGIIWELSPCVHRPLTFESYQAHGSSYGHKQPFNRGWEAGEVRQHELDQHFFFSLIICLPLL